MRRLAAIIVCLLTVSAHAQVIGEAAWIPTCGRLSGGEDGPSADSIYQTYDQMQCAMFRPCIGVNAVDEISFSITPVVLGSYTGTVGHALYSEDGSTQLFATTTEYDEAVSWDWTEPVSPTFDLVYGQKYLQCWCFAPGSEGTLVGLSSSASATNRLKDLAGTLLNVTRVGFAANSCSSGVPPPTTGGLVTPGTYVRSAPALFLRGAAP